MPNVSDYGLSGALSISTGTPFNSVGTGTLLVKTGVGRLAGIFCSAAANTPTLTIYDSLGAAAASAGTILTTFTPVAATMYNFGVPILFTTGLYVTGGGSVQAAIFYY